MTQLKGRLSIGRYLNSDDEESIHIELVDENSHIQFLEIKMDHEAFANAIFSLQANVSFELRFAENVGKTRERKEVVLELPTSYGYTDEERSKAQKDAYTPHEVDGWQVVEYDLSYNMHKVVSYNKKNKTFTRRVGFIRYV
jgi:hypothetical protein